MRRRPALPWLACAVAVAWGCGGSAFSLAPGDGGDDTSVGAEGGPDATGDVPTDDGSGSSSGDAPGVDAPHGDATAHDGGGLDALPPPDALEEPPPTCNGQSFACVPAVPVGWTGPLEVYAGTGLPPPCSTQFQIEATGTTQLDAPTPTCGCTCGSPKVQCGNTDITFYPASPCTSVTGCAKASLPPGTCTTTDVRAQCPSGAAMGTFMGAATTAVVGQSCAPQPTRTVPPLTWATNVRACISSVAPSQLDCQAGQVCAPKSQSPYGSSPCIAATGDQPCPQGPYSSRQVFYGGATDSRDCTSCTCTDPANATCTTTLDTFSSGDGTCSGGAISYGAPFSCDPVNSQPSDFRATTTASAGSCTASQSAPTGSAVPTSPVTLCCTP
jgi:hypothetical protein